MNTALEFSQYGTMLSRLAQSSLQQVTPQAPATHRQTASVLMGVPAATLLLRDDPTLYPALADGLRQMSRLAQATTGGDSDSGPNALPRLVDTAGHWRDIYWPFVLHLHLAAFIRRFESLPGTLWGACEEAVPTAVEPARWIEAYTGEPPPPSTVAMVLWSALCLCEQAVIASRDADVEWVESVVHHVVDRPGPNGALHPTGPAGSSEQDQSLDAWTYRELCGLHALANLAVRRRNRVWARHVERVALYHLEHTQPDNATNQPWGVFGFLWSPKTRTMGQQQLHDVTAHHSDGPASALAGMLLADAAATLEAMKA